MGKVTKDSTQRANSKRRARRSRFWIGVVLLVVVVVLIVVAVFVARDSRQDDDSEELSAATDYQQVLQRYYAALLTEDGQVIAQCMAPPSYWTYYLATYGRTEDEVMDAFAEMAAETTNEWTTLYGESLELQYKILGMSEPAQEGIDEWNSDMADQLGNHDLDILDAVTLEVELTVTGATGSGDITLYPTLVEMEDGWYMLEPDASET